MAIGEGQLLALILVAICLRENFCQIITCQRGDWEIGAVGYPVKIWVNMTKNELPQNITFDACEVLTCGNLNAQQQLSSENKYLCPKPKTSGLFKAPLAQDGVVYGG